MKHKVEEAEALSAISRHQQNLDVLEDYEGMLYIDGESYNSDTLKLLYVEALDNVCSGAVLDLFASIDSSDVRDSLINEVFLDLAIAQHKKTQFISQLNKRLKKYREPVNTAAEPQKLCQYVVEDALSEMGLSVRLNLVTKRIEVSGYGAEALFELYSRSNILNILPTLILDRLRADNVKGLGQGTKLIEQYIFNIADINRYNPIHEMLEAHENTDEGCHAVLCAMLGIYDEFDMLLVKKWFIQSVALAFNSLEKPVSAEGVLVLQGSQGCGKTSFFRRMSLKPEWFTEGAVIDVRNKDSVISALSTWICELGEIDCTLQREQSALKAFITRPLDRIRFPYAPAESEMARNTSLCGTVNPDKFLNDLTGARRYWVINVDKILTKELYETDDEEIMNIWGYYYHLYKENPDSFRLTESERERVEGKNRSHSCELKYEAEVLELLDFTLEECYWSEVRPAALAGFMGNTNAVQVGKILTKLAEEDKRITVTSGNNVKKYLLPLKKPVHDSVRL
ncbi:MAG: virulence-associated E family protein [Ruminococcus sp.]|nr:virulence-associated E family protein [Ruminococcus sp.]